MIHPNQTGSTLFMVMMVVLIISSYIIEYKTINWQQQKLLVIEQQRVIKAKKDKSIFNNITDDILAYKQLDNIPERFYISKSKRKVNLFKIADIKQDKVTCKAYKAKINRFIDLPAGDQYHEKLYLMACAQNLEYSTVVQSGSENAQAINIIPITSILEI